MFYIVFFYFCRKLLRVDSNRNFPKYIVFILFLLIVSKSNGQLLVEADTTKILDETPLEEIHSPRKAAIYSAILPGLGQAYNKKIWKIPFVYGGFGGIGYFVGWNNKRFQFYKQSYYDFTNDLPGENSYEQIPAYRYMDPNNSSHRENFKSGLTRQQDYFRRNRDLLAIVFVGFYGLQIIDASVDAHMFDFDMSEDLTLNWQPSVQYIQNQAY